LSLDGPRAKSFSGLMPPSIRKIQSALLDWYDEKKRDLPWRASRDPYRILISEVMLQQTQVATVIPYYRRFVKAFPSIEALARASETRVLKHWEGLGYYSRARHLQAAARIIHKEHRGRVPDTLEEILKLPGIGRYTAAAVLSIAFDREHPVLDGNVKRVLSRLFCLAENGRSTGSEKRLWQTAEQLLARQRPGDFNQAMMELGATVCLPKNPRCSRCPAGLWCLAYQKGVPEEFPPAKARTTSEKIEVSAAVISRNGKMYIQKRPAGGLMGGLWEFPGGKLEEGESPEAALEREILEEEKLLTLKHSYTRFAVTLHVYRCHIGPGRLRPTCCDAWKWVALEELDTYPFPAANVKILKHLTGQAAKQSCAPRRKKRAPGRTER
jgi:A/G-specific adenine glycosylase